MMQQCRPGLALAVLMSSAVHAQTPSMPAIGTGGSPAFCLVEVPVEDAAKRRLVNLAHVQYLEVTGAGVKLFFGGGNFGAGHEALIPAATPAEAQSVIEKLRRGALACTPSTNARGGN